MLNDAPQTPLRLLVLIPALDEERTIGAVIESVPKSISGISTIEIVVIDDGSVDATPRVASSAGATVVSRPVSGGLGAAFQTGLERAIDDGADVVVTIDADGQFDATDIPRLIRPIQDGEADFVTASRFKDRSLTPKMPASKRWGNVFLSRVISALAGQRIYDVSCGMRAYNREAILRLHLLARFTYTQEVILNLAFKRLRIVEVPLLVRGEREHGSSRVAKSLWRYGWKALRIIVRSYRDYRPLRFFLSASAVLLVLAGILAGFLGFHYAQEGSFSPHKWAAAAAGLLMTIAAFLVHLGTVGDMLNRHREYLEELLYRQRRAAERSAVEGGMRRSGVAGSPAISTASHGADPATLRSPRP